MELIKMNDLYVREVGKLCNALTEASIAYEVYHAVNNHGFIILFPNKENHKGDVILHDYSYGHEGGLFEGYAAMSKVEGDVYVFDTIEEIVELAKKNGFFKEEEYNEL